MSTQAHWNEIYTKSPDDQLGWHETAPEASLRLLARCHLQPDDPIVDVGSGASRLVDCLVHRHYSRIHAVDISKVALAVLRARLSAEEATRVQFHEADLAQQGALADLDAIALWHDRALLHFLIEPAARDAYRATLHSAVRPGGYVILAAFACHGATHCSGLPVERYTADKLAAFLGAEFHLQTSFDYLYHQPSGDTRPYIYTCFQRSG